MQKRKRVQPSFFGTDSPLIKFAPKLSEFFFYFI